MSDFNLYREPTLLDVVAHRHLKLAPVTDQSMTEGMHASFLAATEFAHAAREYVIVFIRDLADGAAQIRPIVLLGLNAGENLYLDRGVWDGRYLPAYIRRYPFWLTQLEGQPAPAVVFDNWWKGFSPTDGDPLYEGENRPAPRLAEAIDFLQSFEVEVARTHAFCQRLLELDLLRDMAANVQLPGGKTLELNGFFTVDTAKLEALPDATVVELHRNGILNVLHAHLLSLGNLPALVERRVKRMALAEMQSKAAAPA